MIIRPQVTNENEFGLSTELSQMAQQKSIATGMFEYMDDFVTEVDSGVDSYIVTALTSGEVSHGAEHGGVIVVDSGAATDNQGVGSAQLDSNGVVKVASGKNIYCEMRVNRLVQSGGQFWGLAAVDTTVMTATHFGAIGVGFVCDAGSSAITALDVITTNSGTANTTETVTADVLTGMASDDKYRTYGIHIIGNGEVRYYIDRVLVATHTTSANIPTSALVPTFTSVNSAATQSKLEVDYIYIAADR